MINHKSLIEQELSLSSWPCPSSVHIRILSMLIYYRGWRLALYCCFEYIVFIFLSDWFEILYSLTKFDVEYDCDLKVCRNFSFSTIFIYIFFEERGALPGPKYKTPSSWWSLFGDSSTRWIPYGTNFTFFNLTADQKSFNLRPTKINYKPFDCINREYWTRWFYIAYYIDTRVFLYGLLIDGSFREHQPKAHIRTRVCQYNTQYKTNKFNILYIAQTSIITEKSVDLQLS